MTLPTIRNKSLLEEAFTHRSYLNETKEKIQSNERLEFLGDSILSFVVSEYLFKSYPSFNEGILTNLRSLIVNTKSLAAGAKELGLGERLLMSKGEKEAKGSQNPSLLADSFEAFVGALFLDQGIASVRDFILQTILRNVKTIVEKKAFKDPKSMLQELIQAKNQHFPIYRVLKEEGPAHAKLFLVGVYVDNILLGQGEGKSKQEAEENAAKVALEKASKE
ncbi:MAG: ribonuclease III [Candidatus Levybacteria bacterium]|nr:ribonuclease III [Candidatus Levybacteria bacterium]